jgi:RNA polymerase sigma-70 factor (ECF subfamily)
VVIAAAAGGRLPRARPSGSVTREMVPGGSAGLAGPAQQESRAWIARLRADGPEREAAIADLHALLVRAARFEVGRRRASFPQLRGGDHEDLAQQSADDALLAILAKLGDFRGESRFTTWAYKFVLYEAAAKVRRRAWQGREIPLEAEGWLVLADRRSDPHADAETGDVLRALQDAIRDELTPHQREVLVALALNEVPIDVLADRLSTTRGALYKTLHDARRKLRGALAARGLDRDRHDGRTAG